MSGPDVGAPGKVGTEGRAQDRETEKTENPDVATPAAALQQVAPPLQMQQAPRWLLWKIETRTVKTGPKAGQQVPVKVPYYTTGERRRGDLNNDGDRLVTYAEACVAAMMWGYGLAFALGEGWQGIDYDHVDQHPELLDLLALAPGYVEVSPSGTGYHAIGYGAPFDALGSNPSGIEAYAGSRFFTFTGWCVRQGPIVDLAPHVLGILAPRHAAARKPAGPVQPRPPVPETGDRVLDELADALRFIDADDRDTWVRVGQALFPLGEAGYALWEAWSATSERFPGGDDLERWNTFKGERTGYASIFNMATASGWKNPRKGKRNAAVIFAGGQPFVAPAIPAVPATRIGGADGLHLADFVAYLPAHNYAHLPTREMWPASSVDGHVSDWPRSAEGKAIKPSTWLDQHQCVHQMTWAPGRPQIIRDEAVHLGGFEPLPGNSILNVYLPPRDLGGDPANVGPWLEHLQTIYPEDWAHLLCWFAHRLQRPHEKVNHALVLGGAPGIGKDTIFEPLKRGVGPANAQEISPVQMLARFNGWIKCVLLRVSELRDLGEVNRFAFYEHCKTFLASPPEVLRVDEKNLREHYAVNVLGVVFTTNNRTDGLYLPADDRRHYVAWSEATREQFAIDYWKRLWGWYDAGGAANVVAFLRAFDLSHFDAKAPPPKTRAFWSIVQAAEAPESSELRDAIESMGPDGDAFTLRDLSAAAMACGLPGLCAELNDRRQHRSIPHKLDRVGFQSVRNPGTGDGRWKVDGRNQSVYARVGLSISDQIRAAQVRSAKSTKSVISHPHP